MTDVLLRLLVLKTRRLGPKRAFYDALGVELAEERHGNGPVHYAGKVGDAVLEIYPLPEGGNADTTTRLGFAVANLAQTVQSLRDAGVIVTSEPQQTGWGLRDPDGRAVELYQR